MAKNNGKNKGNKSKRIIKLDMSNVEGRMLVAEGDYKAKVKDVTSEVGEDSGKPYLQFVMEIVGGEYEGQTLYHKCSLQPQALFNLKNTLLAMGESVPQKAMDLDLDELIGKELGIAVNHETYEGKKKSKIQDVFPLSGDDDEEDDEEVDLDEMDLDELKAYAKENEIDLSGLSKADKKKADKVRAAIQEALDAEDDEEEDDEESDDEEEVDLDELDLDGLKAFAKENDIDLSEMSKKDKKNEDKVRAFIKENMPEDDEDDEEDEKPDYSEMEEDELKKLCKEKDIKVGKKDKKKDLIKKLEEADASEDDEDDV